MRTTALSYLAFALVLHLSVWPEEKIRLRAYDAGRACEYTWGDLRETGSEEWTVKQTFTTCPDVPPVPHRLGTPESGTAHNLCVRPP
ncbi:MAG TPA: hypothetical protein VEO19_05530 [Terriglobia bacterium]|nr:hypothetical protein [Terriglobia bacterium]